MVEREKQVKYGILVWKIILASSVLACSGFVYSWVTEDYRPAFNRWVDAAFAVFALSYLWVSSQQIWLLRRELKKELVFINPPIEAEHRPGETLCFFITMAPNKRGKWKIYDQTSVFFLNLPALMFPYSVEGESPALACFNFLVRTGNVPNDNPEEAALALQEGERIFNRVFSKHGTSAIGKDEEE